MSLKNNEIAKLSFSLPIQIHQQLKSMAFTQQKSMEQLLIEIITKELSVQKCMLGHEPNEETQKAIQDVKERKNLLKFESLDDLFEDLGI